MLPLRSVAPEFTLFDDRGTSVNLAALRGAASLVLYFYPADFTPGCTREACDVRDLHTRLLTAGFHVAGISPQDVVTHARFKAHCALPYSLLADPDKSVIRVYDVEGPLGFGVRRATYLIGPDGRIFDAVLADFRVGRHREFLENALKAAASGAAPVG